MLTLASWSPWIIYSLMLAFVFVCLLLVLIILIQKPRGGGLSGAFGGGGGGGAQEAFGAKTGDVLTWITVALFASFLMLAIVLTWGTDPQPTSPAALTSGQRSDDPPPIDESDPAPQTPPQTPAPQVPEETPAPQTPESDPEPPQDPAPDAE